MLISWSNKPEKKATVIYLEIHWNRYIWLKSIMERSEKAVKNNGKQQGIDQDLTISDGDRFQAINYRCRLYLQLKRYHWRNYHCKTRQNRIYRLCLKAINPDLKLASSQAKRPQGGRAVSQSSKHENSDKEKLHFTTYSPRNCSSALRALKY